MVRVLLLLLAVMSQGCVYIIHTKPLFDMTSEFRDLTQRSRKGHDEFSVLLKEVRKASSTPDAAPYPAMAADLAKMKRHLLAVEKIEKDTWDMRLRFDKLAAGRSEIHSDWPEYADAEKINSGFRDKYGPLKEESDAMIEAANAFSAKAAAAGIGSVDTEQARAQARDYMAKFAEAQAGVKGNIAKAREVFARRSAATLGIRQYKDQRDALDKMEGILGRMDAKKVTLDVAVQEFLDRKDLPARAYRGPGIARNPVLEALTKAGDEMQVLVTEFNGLADKLK